MSDIFQIKRGDTSSSLVYALDPASVVLTGATVRFSMRHRVTRVVKLSRVTARIVTATGAPTVAYDWQPGDTADAGGYEAEFEVTYAGGAIETFPNLGFIGVSIAEDIA